MKKTSSEKSLEKGKKKDVRLWQTLARVYHIQLLAFGLFLQKWNLSVSQYSVLKHVFESERISQKDLAEKLLVSKGNVTQLIGKLERTGYIQREQQWKTKYISLTKKGQTVCQKLLPEQESYFAGQFQSLTKKEEKQVIKLLQKMMPEEKASNEEKSD